MVCGLVAGYELCTLIEVGRFYFGAFDTLGMDVLYQPVLTPTMSLGEASNPINISDDEEAPHQFPEPVQRQFYPILKKELSVPDITCDMIVCLKLHKLLLFLCIYIYLFSEYLFR